MSDLLGESHHLEADEEHQEAPRELVITPPQPKNILVGASGPVVVLVPETKK